MSVTWRDTSSLAQKCSVCRPAAASSAGAGNASATSTAVAVKQLPQNASVAAPSTSSSASSQSPLAPTEVVFLFGCARRYFHPSKDYDFTSVSVGVRKLDCSQRLLVEVVCIKAWRGSFRLCCLGFFGFDVRALMTFITCMIAV